MHARQIGLAGNFIIPAPSNAIPREFAPGSPEAESVLGLVRALMSNVRDIPHVIKGERTMEGEIAAVTVPHRHAHVIGRIPQGGDAVVDRAMDSALAAKQYWAKTPWWERAAVFLRAADLAMGKYRDELVASTMVGQSKTFHQAEIDAPCEVADFLRYNVYNMHRLLADQPASIQGTTNYWDHRPLEGFILAITPFNFTAIASNLPTTAALLGNVVVWKPSEKSALSNEVLMRMFEEAGLPPGVINVVHGPGEMVSERAMAHADFAGLSFTGSSEVFRGLWKKAAKNIDKYRTFPRLVGETGGKNAVIAHPSAEIEALQVALIRGVFEFQGQKCSAASRAYLPRSIWERIEHAFVETVKSLKVGDPTHHDTFVGAVIDEQSAQKLQTVFDEVQALESHRVLVGGSVDLDIGWFVSPTLLLTDDPRAFTMEDEFFGPVLTVYVYEDDDWESMLELVDTTSKYALTLSVFSRDQMAISSALEKLRYAAGMTYINDKPTGALMGQVSFGGGRGSGTNDKTGSPLALQRWLSGRFIRENYAPDTDWRYNYMAD